MDEYILSEREEPLRFRGSQRKRVSRYLKDRIESQEVLALAESLLHDYMTDGYPFSTPRMKSCTEDFSASTENSPGQGYWFSIDKKRENEIIFFLKLLEPHEQAPLEKFPYRTKTLPLRFLDWLPRAAKKDRKKATTASKEGKQLRALKLRFRAMKFEDMHLQLMNTIELQHVSYQYARLKSRNEKDSEKIKELQEEIIRLRRTRRCGPPRLLLSNGRVTLQIPFLPPTNDMVDEELGPRTYRRRAGADRGIRVPLVLSVRNGETEYADKLVSFNELLIKRDLLRCQSKDLISKVRRMRNNWERKHPMRDLPSFILKKERHLSAIWRKIQRLDREIARQVASRTVWFCEKHGVKTLYFENLKNYTPPAGWGNLSWRLSSNLWSKIFDSVTYMRQALGHRFGGVWTVNPAWTSQRCHVCGDIGMRVGSTESTTEIKGGEFFRCLSCGCSIHADVNAARNIIDVRSITPSAVSGQKA